MNNKNKINIIGGGLAGCEAAYQISKIGIDVDLYEMRPKTKTEAHNTEYLGELVVLILLDQMIKSSMLLGSYTKN